MPVWSAPIADNNFAGKQKRRMPKDGDETPLTFKSFSPLTRFPSGSADFAKGFNITNPSALGSRNASISWQQNICHRKEQITIMQIQTKTPQSGKTAALFNKQKTNREDTLARADVNTIQDPGTFGPSELCTWSVAAGACRFQTNQPSIARKLSQRSGAGLVAWSVNGGYLRIFQERISPRLARKLVSRYLKGFSSLKGSHNAEITPTNARFLSLKRPPSRRNPYGKDRTGVMEERAA
jgi:hypothetical protein